MQESSRLDVTFPVDGRVFPVDRFAATLFRSLQAPILRHPSGLILLAAIVAGVAAARAFISLIGSQAFTTDAFMLFDGAWRMMSGQRPHFDFYSHMGLLTYVPTIVGLKLSHGTAWGFGYSQALVAIVLTVWMFLLGRTRAGDVVLFFLCVNTVLIAAAPYAIGFGPLNLGPGMVYNRYGYILVALVMLEAFSTERVREGPSALLGGISTGAVLAIALFLKITYFAAAVFLLAAFVGSKPQSSRRWIGIGCGFALATLPVAIYYGFNFGPFVSDMRLIAAGKQIPWRTYLLDGMAKDALLIVVLAMFASLAFWESGRVRKAWTYLFAGIAVAIAGLLCMMGNHEYTGFPLAASFALIVMDEIAADNRHAGRAADLLRVCCVLLGAVFVLTSLIGQSLGVGYGLLDRFWVARTSLPLNSPVMAGLTFAADDKAYVDFFNDGFDVIRRNRKPSESVMSLDFSNPFLYALQIPPARGGTTVLQYRTTFNDKAHPSPEWLVGNYDLLMIPKTYSDGSLEVGIPKLYGPYINRHFRLAKESNFWKLYRKTGV